MLQRKMYSLNEKQLHRSHEAVNSRAALYSILFMNTESGSQ